jgi:hypothetical protein
MVKWLIVVDWFQWECVEFRQTRECRKAEGNVGENIEGNVDEDVDGNA